LALAASGKASSRAALADRCAGLLDGLLRGDAFPIRFFACDSFSIRLFADDGFRFGYSSSAGCSGFRCGGRERRFFLYAALVLLCLILACRRVRTHQLNAFL